MLQKETPPGPLVHVCGGCSPGPIRCRIAGDWNEWGFSALARNGDLEWSLSEARLCSFAGSRMKEILLGGLHSEEWGHALNDIYQRYNCLVMSDI